MRRMFFSVCLLSAMLCSVVRGDILEYYPPGSSQPLTLQGRVTVNPGRTVSFRHPKFGTIHFGLKDVRFHEVPTTIRIADTNIKKAKDDVEKSIEAARWALHHGHLDKFNKAASQAWNLDPNHPTVKRLVAMKRKMKVNIPESKQREQEMQEIMKTPKSMKFLRSEHFLLLHDCAAAKPSYMNKLKSRAEQRLALLEQVYESFLLKYCLEGVDLNVPKERMMVVLFADRDNYLIFSKSLTPDAEKAAGFFHKIKNISVFYDQSTNDDMIKLLKFKVEMRRAKKEAMRVRATNTKDIVHLVNALDLMIEVIRENQDIEVVSHETTHQMAGNTGLQPNDSTMPTWAAEGVATYFESPKEAAWAGIGAVNETRLAMYRTLQGNTQRSNINFIVSNRIFIQASSGEETLHAYAQAWALTHFLMTRHFDKLMKYYKLAGKRKLKDYKEIKTIEYFQFCQADFDAIFGKDKSQLNREWRTYMNALKTDLELVLGRK